MSDAACPPRPPIRFSFVRNTALVAFGLAALSVGLHMGATRLGATLRLAGASLATDPVAITIAGAGFQVPANVIRFPEQRVRGAALGELDLYLAWPSLKGFSEADASLFNDPASHDLVFIRLMEVEPTEVPDAIQHAPLVPAPWTAKHLKARKGDAVGGLDLEETIYEGPSRRMPGYSVSCLADEPATGLSAGCMREITIAPGLRLRYRFSRSRLDEWDAIDRAVLRYVDEHRRP